MAIEFKRSKVGGRFPEIWRGECKVLPGGFKPVQDFAVGTLVRRATLLHVDFDAMTAAVVKIAKVLTGSTTKNVRVAKNTLFAVGDFVTKFGNGAAAPTITAIDTANEDYDVLTLSTAYTGLAADDVIVESTEKPGEGTAAPKYEPNAVVAADVEFTGKGLPTFDAAYEAVVLKNAVPYFVPEEWLAGICLKFNPNIVFIKQ